MLADGRARVGDYKVEVLITRAGFFRARLKLRDNRRSLALLGLSPCLLGTLRQFALQPLRRLGFRFSDQIVFVRREVFGLQFGRLRRCGGLGRRGLLHNSRLLPPVFRFTSRGLALTHKLSDAFLDGLGFGLVALGLAFRACIVGGSS
jgi:hypothetical protein